MIDDGKYLLRLIVSNATFAELSHYAYASYAMHTFSSLFIFIAKCPENFCYILKKTKCIFSNMFLYNIHIHIHIHTNI